MLPMASRFDSFLLTLYVAVISHRSNPRVGDPQVEQLRLAHALKSTSKSAMTYHHDCTGFMLYLIRKGLIESALRMFLT